MIFFLALLIGKVDTLELPQPAKAVTVSPDYRIACLARTGDEIFVTDEDGAWRHLPLPERIGTTQRILFSNDMVYVLNGRKLALYDLRNASKGIVADDVDDAAMTETGELWALSDFTLSRLSPLGILLEERALSTTPASIWEKGETLYLVSKEGTLPLDSAWIDDLDKLGIDASELAKLGVYTAITDQALFFLTDPNHILVIKK